MYCTQCGKLDEIDIPDRTRVLNGSSVFNLKLNPGSTYKRKLIITIINDSKKDSTEELIERLCKPCFLLEIKNNLFLGNLT